MRLIFSLFQLLVLALVINGCTIPNSFSTCEEFIEFCKDREDYRILRDCWGEAEVEQNIKFNELATGEALAGSGRRYLTPNGDLSAEGVYKGYEAKVWVVWRNVKVGGHPVRVQFTAFPSTYSGPLPDKFVSVDCLYAEPAASKGKESDYYGAASSSELSASSPSASAEALTPVTAAPAPEDQLVPDGVNPIQYIPSAEEGIAAPAPASARSVTTPSNASGSSTSAPLSDKHGESDNRTGKVGDHDDRDGALDPKAIYGTPGESASKSVKRSNSLSPNGDGRDDVLSFDNGVVSPDNELKVTDRWGREVFSRKNYDNSWDGGDLPPGTYYYLYTAGGRTEKGWIELVR